eukprot:COSAG06_NODE_581_length_14007_cov_3.569056_5_plen_58_part_00
MEKSGEFMQVTGHLFSLDFDEAANRGAGAADPGGASLLSSLSCYMSIYRSSDAIVER